ncbi:MAG: dihydrodipicolinate synthase family protein [Opitutales bacterium]
MESTAAILATAVVPWTERLEFDEETFCRQVHTIAQGLTRAIYIFGTAGEGYAVTERQFDQIAAAFWRVAQAAGVTPMVGLISLSLPTVVERIARGRALGFRHFQLSLPSWGALTDRELDVFFAETCGRFPDCDFHHYNLARTKRLLTGADYVRLAAAHPNFVAVKYGASDPAVVADVLTAAPRLRFYFTEQGYALARRMHDVGLLVSMASIHYGRARAYVAGDEARRTADAAELRTILASLLEVGRGRFHIDGAFDKILFKLTDPGFPLRVLPPYASPTEEDFARFRAMLPAGWRQ